MAVLVRRIASGQKHRLAKVELFFGQAQKRDVSKVHGIKRSAQNADFLAFHTLIIHHDAAGEKHFSLASTAWIALFGEKFP